MSKLIELSVYKGKLRYAIVDDEDFEYLVKCKWYVKSNAGGILYAATCIRFESNERMEIRMHRLIMCAANEMDVDHKNHNGFDNRKINLRLCTKSQNMGNRRKNKNGTEFKGVNWYPKYNKFVARIQIKNKSVNNFLGYFSNKIEAAKAYNIAALKYFGEFAYLNKIPNE